MLESSRTNFYGKSEPAPMDIAVEDYADLVKSIAQHMIVRLPASVQLDDLIQAGLVGLIEATRRYDASRGASFETYAGIRIRGAMVDEIRKGDWVPRSVHRNARRISDTIMSVEAELGREATDREIAEAMGIELDEYHEMSRDAVSGYLFSIDEPAQDFDGEPGVSLVERTPQLDEPSPFHKAQQQGLQTALSKAIETLPEREQLVLSLYYQEELNLKEIGEVLGVSESRVSQIHSQAALRLKAKLKEW